MAYNNAIPQASDRIKDSQSQILDNFAAIKTLVDINHVTFDAVNQGKHKYVSMPEQSSDPTTAANEVAIYTKAVSGVSQLFLRNEGDGSVVDWTSATKTSNGTTTLPSGLILKWGQSVTAPVTGITTITFGTAFPTAILSCMANFTMSAGSSTTANDGYVRIYAYDTSKLDIVGFTLNNFNRGALSFSWFAIGY